MKLRKIREKRELFQKDIADELGVSRQTITNWEIGIREPSIELIVKLCEILKTTPNYLLDYDDDQIIEYL